MGDMNRALRLAERDGAFRAYALQDAATTLPSYDLTDQERIELVHRITEIERGLEDDPLDVTEADHGQADAAGLKNERERPHRSKVQPAQR